MLDAITAIDLGGTEWLSWLEAMTWQVSILAAVVFAVSLLARKASPRFRYCLWSLVLIKLCLPPDLSLLTGIGNWLPGEPARSMAPAATVNAGTQSLYEAVARPASETTALFDRATPNRTSSIDIGPAPVRVSPRPATPALDWPTGLFIVWAAGVLVVVGFVCRQYIRLRAILSAGKAVDDERIKGVFKRARDSAGVTANVDLLSSARVRSPFLFGLFRPRIVIPADTLQTMVPSQIEPILLHELCHVHRRDVWANWFQLVLQAIYWFHPLVWLANLKIRSERELIVDDMVLAHLNGRSEDYGNSLLHIVRQAASRPALAPSYVGISEPGGRIAHRIRRIIDTQRRISLRIGWKSAVLVVGLGLILIPQARSSDGEATTTSNESGPARIVENGPSEKADPLTIVCVDADGNPVPGAEVYLVENVYRPAQTNVVGPAKADDMSVVRFPGISKVHEDRGWARHVYARLPGRMAGVGEHSYTPGWSHELPEDPFKVRLAEIGEVRGSISVPKGFLPQDVTIRLLGMQVPGLKIPARYSSFTPHDVAKPNKRFWPETFERQADREGRFVFKNIPAGARVYLAAEGPGLGQAQFMSNNPMELRQISMVVAPEGVIEGTLRYKDTGKPAEGIAIAAFPQGILKWQEPFETTVRLDGSYRIDGLPDNVYHLSLPHRASREDWTMAVKTGVRLAASETIRGIDLFLEKGAIVSGTVSDSQTGKPIANASISALNPGEMRGTGIGVDRTDENGRYELRLPVGKTKLYMPSAPPPYNYRGDQARTYFEVSEGETSKEGVDFKLDSMISDRTPPKFATVKGRVLDSNGEPMFGVHVRANMAKWSTKADWVDPRGHTGEDGHFKLTVLADTAYAVTANHAEYSAAKSESFQVESGGIRDVGDLSLFRGTTSLAGTVVDPDGRPIANATVMGSSKNKSSVAGIPRPNTDQEGRFRLENLIDGELLAVSIKKVGYETRNWNNVAPGGEDLRFAIHPSDGLPYNTGTKKPPKPSTLIGKPAPAWDVGQWVQEPKPPSRPDRGDGKTTALVFVWSSEDWAKLGPELAELEATCAKSNAVPVAILSYPGHESSIEPAIAKHGLTMGVGIERYVPQSEYTISGAMMAAYGTGKMPMVFVIDSDGKIRHFQSGFEGVEKQLRGS
jgi:beta-lactamase regulating signal transducer with metallopeptidase domain